MVSEKRRAYMKEYMRRKRAREKQTVKPSLPSKIEVSRSSLPSVIPEGCTPIGVSDFNVCMHCRSKQISRNGNIVHCRACGITYDLTVGFVRNVFGKEDEI